MISNRKEWYQIENDIKQERMIPNRKMISNRKE